MAWCLQKVVFDLFEQSLFRRQVVDRQRFRQLLQQLLLLARHLRGHLDVDMHVQVAARVAVEDGDALVTQAELRAVLRAFGDLQLIRLFERGNFDFSPQRRLRNKARIR